MTHENNSRSTFGAFKETLIACTFDLGGLIAGFIIASQLGIFKFAPWVIAVYPAILGAKGVMHGLFNSRLDTALHLGTIHPRFFNNTKSFSKLVGSAIAFTLVISAIMGAFSLFFGSIFWGLSTSDFLSVILVVIATMALGLLLNLFTIKLTFIAFTRAYDPDIIVYPVMSTIADIFMTISYVVIVNLFFLFTFIGQYVVGGIVLVDLALLLLVVPKNFKEQDFKKTLKESLFAMVFVSVIANITGTVFKNINSIIGDRSALVYTVYPAMMDVAGDVSSIVGSTATTKLALGLLRPSMTSIVRHGKAILSAWAASLVVFLLLGILSTLVNGVFTVTAFSTILPILFISNVIAVLTTVLVSYGVSILTFQKGLDRDNFVFPFACSFADTLMTLSLLVALVMLR